MSLEDRRTEKAPRESEVPPDELGGCYAVDHKRETWNQGGTHKAEGTSRNVYRGIGSGQQPWFWKPGSWGFDSFC